MMCLWAIKKKNNKKKTEIFCILKINEERSRSAYILFSIHRHKGTNSALRLLLVKKLIQKGKI
jgi:hypothetical protein